MFAIATLMFEHRVIDRGLLAVQRLIEEAAGTGLDGREELAKLVEFLTAYVEEIHWPKEVESLSARLVETQRSDVFGPISAMLGDHETGRAAARRLAVSARSSEPWTSTEVQLVAQAVVDWSGLLREHMEQEESVLFALARRSMDAETAQRVEAQFEEHARATVERAQELSDLATNLVSRWAPTELWRESGTGKVGDYYAGKHLCPSYSSLLLG